MTLAAFGQRPPRGSAEAILVPPSSRVPGGPHPGRGRRHAHTCARSSGPENATQDVGSFVARSAELVGSTIPTVRPATFPRAALLVASGFRALDISLTEGRAYPRPRPAATARAPRLPRSTESVRAHRRRAVRWRRRTRGLARLPPRAHVLEPTREWRRFGHGAQRDGRFRLRRRGGLLGRAAEPNRSMYANRLVTAHAPRGRSKVSSSWTAGAARAARPSSRDRPQEPEGDLRLVVVAEQLGRWRTM